MTSAILYTRDGQNNPNTDRLIPTLLSERHLHDTVFLSPSMQLTARLLSLSAQLGQYLLSRSTVSHSIVPSHCRWGCTCVAPPSFSSCSSSEGRGADRASRRGRGQSHPAGAATHPHTEASVSVPQRKKKQQSEAPNTRTGLRPTDQYKNII